MGFPGSSAGKESACNAGDPSSIPRWGRSAGEGTDYPLQYSWVSLMAQMVKNLSVMCNAGDSGSVPGSGRSLGEGKGYPLQHFGLENSKLFFWGFILSLHLGHNSLLCHPD